MEMLATIRKYLKILTTSIKVFAAYKTNIFFNVLAMFVKVLFAFVLWSIIYESHNTIAGYSFQQMILYYILCSFVMQLDKTEIITNTMSEEIQNGKFAKYLIMPIKLEKYFFTYSLGATVLNTLFIAVGCACLVYLIQIDASISVTFSQSVILFIIVLLGIIFMSKINYLIGILSMKYIDVTIFILVKDNIFALLKGELIPLVLLPKSVFSAMKYFPFYYIGYYPVNTIITGNLESVWLAIAVLLIWIICLGIFNKHLFAKYKIVYEGTGL